MSIALSSADLDRVSRSIQVLVSPLDHGDVDGWRAAVNGALRELLYADSAVFLLPEPEGPTLYSDEYDASELSKYPELTPPPLPDGTSIFDRELAVGVGTLPHLYGENLGDYLRSEFYNEYAAPNRAHGSLSAAVIPAAGPRGAFAGIQLWHHRLDGFGDREIALLRLLFPAFQAGVEASVRWAAARTELLDSLDGLAHPSAVFDHAGRVVHETPALAALLEGDAEPLRIRGELRSLAREMSRCGGDLSSWGSGASAELVRDIATASARYRLSGCAYRGPGAAAPEQPCILIGIQRLTPARRSEQELMSTYSLTAGEARVAALLGDGRSNAEIAKTLFISPHTARRHTERVLQKLNVRSRAQVAAHLVRS